MQKIVLKKPSFFIGKNITVFDNKNDVFYISITDIFSLPKGTFFVDKPIKKIKAKYSNFPNLPQPERILKVPKFFKVFWGENKNGVSVWLNSGKILFDNKYKKANIFQAVYIYFHEFGHYYYSGNFDNGNGEFYCDLFAFKNMLKMGFNPTQCFLAIATTVRNKERVNVALKILKQVQIKK